MGKVIIWDFDKTMGLFNENDETSEESDKEDEPMGFRHGIEKVLRATMGRGYRHVIATNHESYTHVVDLLEKKGIFDLFVRVFSPGYGFDPQLGRKDYPLVLRYLDMDIKQARKDAAVIGDSVSRDMPSDEGLLFINQEDGYKYDSDVINRILLSLESKSDDFEMAFSKMFEKTTIWATGVKRFQLDEQIGFSMEYVNRGMVFVPRIYDVCCPYLRRDVEKLVE